MPLGPSHGWGVCGRYLALEMERFTPVRLITDDLECEARNNQSHYKRLSAIHVPLKELTRENGAKEEVQLNGPLLQAIEGHTLRPWLIRAEAKRRIGYTFFEKTRLRKEDVTSAQAYFDRIVAGSKWCQNVLRDHGVTSLSTVIQGIDPLNFHPGYAAKERYKDRFVVFSGGKMELRKGHDIVLRAFKVLQDKHEDVLLVNSWYNQWDDSLMTMRMSPYITFDMPPGNYFKAIDRLLFANGIDPRKVITLPPVPHTKIAEIYKDTDCGLFPNRCEGGTNLVLMEYMACGKPAIASFCTGHTDVVNKDNSILLKDIGKLQIKNEKEELLQELDNPNIDEVIAELNRAYENRESIREIGRKAGEFMQSMTWERAAREFLALMN